MIDLQAFRKQEFKRRELNLKGAKRQQLTLTRPHSGALHIVYVLTHVGVCGGTKIILEHANHLVKHGQQVTLISHFDKPTWFPMHGDVAYLNVPFETELAMGIPPCDVIVATYWREIYECIARRIAPVVYFEQGDYHLFDWDNVNARERAYIHKQYQVVPFVFTVSEGAAAQIKSNFHRDADVIPNAINHSVFYPDKDKISACDIRISMIGSEHNDFKCIQDIKKAVDLLTSLGHKTRVYWVTPDEPDKRTGEVWVNPPQNEIGEALRRAEYFVSASTYESFSLPVLEAMACGCAVLTTRNKGVLSYAQNGNNCLYIQMQSPRDIVEKLLMLHNDDNLRKRIQTGGLETASCFSWDRIIPDLLDYYCRIARFRPVR